MSSLSAKDRVSLCKFTFSDGRRCRTPRVRNHPYFCFDHAQKEARARAADTLGKDLAHFFSNNYLSACDLSTALARLIPAVVRGDVKPRTACTVAYLAQTLLQAIHISQDEYISAFGTDGWRKCIRASVNGNYNYRFPPAPQHTQPQSPPPQPQQPAPPQTQAPQSEIPTLSGLAPSPHTPLPPTSTEFAQNVVAGLRTGQRQAPQAARPNPSAKATPPKPVETLPSCHSEPARHGGRNDERPTSGASPESYREESAFSSPPAPSATSSHAPQTHAAYTAPSSPICQSPRSAPVAAHPCSPPSTVSSTPKDNPPLDSRALHFDYNCRLLVDGKPV